MKKEPYTFPKIYVDEALAKQLTFAQNEYPVFGGNASSKRFLADGSIGTIRYVS